MADRLIIGPGPVRPAPAAPARPPAPQPAGDFHQVLDHALAGTEPLRFSAHAEERLKSSRRLLSADEVARVAQAVDRAARKGARESLVLLSDLALVVSVRSRTVITAVDGQRMRENIFTNIDSAVIL